MRLDTCITDQLPHTTFDSVQLLRRAFYLSSAWLNLSLLRQQTKTRQTSLQKCPAGNAVDTCCRCLFKLFLLPAFIVRRTFYHP